VATTARAELVSYNFTADVTYVSSYLTGQGIGDSVSGSLTYNSDIALFGVSGSLFDRSMDLKLDQLSTVGLTALVYNGQTLTMGEIGWTYAATLVLTGQPYANGLPSSLSLGGGATGSLTLDIFGRGTNPDLQATLTTLTLKGSSGGSSTPELDPSSGVGALSLVLGGLGIVLGRRRRS
jgi:hypothetical protein